jgi:hypothetical protein
VSKPLLSITVRKADVLRPRRPVTRELCVETIALSSCRLSTPFAMIFTAAMPQRCQPSTPASMSSSKRSRERGKSHRPPGSRCALVEEFVTEPENVSEGVPLFVSRPASTVAVTTSDAYT